MGDKIEITISECRTDYQLKAYVMLAFLAYLIRKGTEFDPSAISDVQIEEFMISLQ